VMSPVPWLGERSPFDERSANLMRVGTRDMGWKSQTPAPCEGRR